MRNLLLTGDMRHPVAQFSLLGVKGICSSVSRIFSSARLPFSLIWIKQEFFSELNRILVQSKPGEKAVWETAKEVKERYT